MTAHMKISNTWVQAERVYIKRNDAWVPADEVYVKRSGVWTLAHKYDVTPPGQPILSLEVRENAYMVGSEKRYGRHIRVGVRAPWNTADPTLKSIRVLSTYNGGMPTTQYGGTYTQTPQGSYPKEPWSEFSYNGFNGGQTDTGSFKYKTWPPNATSTTSIAPGRYWFAAWAQDDMGNWGVSTAQYIDVPKTGSAAGTIVKQSRFQTTQTGTYASNGVYTDGRAIARGGSIQRQGLFFYGNVIPARIGQQGAASIRSAQILIQRANDDGEPQANVHLFWHKHATPGDISGSLGASNTTFLGTIGKGESKWFKLPATHIAKLDTELMGFGLWYKNPNFANSVAADYLEADSQQDSLRTGELQVIWEERL